MAGSRYILDAVLRLNPETLGVTDMRTNPYQQRAMFFDALEREEYHAELDDRERREIDRAALELRAENIRRTRQAARRN
ncbi:MAG: hypothetical protein ACYTEQ_27325 [Planctomycetota bacterium]